MSYDIEGRETKIVLDFVNNPNFKGFHLMGVPIPKNCFINEDLFVCNIIDEAHYHPFIINIKSNEFKIDSKNTLILDVYQNSVLGVKSNFLNSQVLVRGQVNSSTLQAEFKDLTSPVNPTLENIIYEENDHYPENSDMKFGSIFVGPKSEKAPLIVWPHGGPHSVIPNSFSSDIFYFLDQGFACLLINYRGSISYGQENIDSLLGKVGDNDVKDCFQVMQCIIKIIFIIYYLGSQDFWSFIAALINS